MTTVSLPTTLTENLLKCWEDARSIFTHQLEKISKEDLKMRMTPTGNSVGFIIRQIGDVEVYFARHIFGMEKIKEFSTSRIVHYDSGEWTNLDKLKAYINYSGEYLRNAIANQCYSEWENVVVCPEFGKKSKSEFLSSIITLTAYRSGQMANILKFGIQPPQYNPNIFGLFEKTCA